MSTDNFDSNDGRTMSLREFRVWCPDKGADRGDAQVVKASDAGEAAEKWAEENDRYGDYNIMTGRSAPIVLVALGDEAPTAYEVSGEALPNTAFLRNECSDLRAQLAAVTEERDIAKENLEAAEAPCDECDGGGYWYLDGVPNQCICVEPREAAVRAERDAAVAKLDASERAAEHLYEQNQRWQDEFCKLVATRDSILSDLRLARVDITDRRCHGGFCHGGHCTCGLVEQVRAAAARIAALLKEGA